MNIVLDFALDVSGRDCTLFFKSILFNPTHCALPHGIVHIVFHFSLQLSMR